MNKIRQMQKHRCLLDSNKQDEGVDHLVEAGRILGGQGRQRSEANYKFAYLLGRKWMIILC
jgi:hypothetical protein